VSVGQNLPNQQAAPTATPEKSTTNSTHNGQTVNYEIGSTKSERVREPGEIRRVTVSVVVDGVIGEHGDFQPRPKEELDRIGELVRSAVGFDAKRGDKVVVDTMRFVAAEPLGTEADAGTIAPSLPWWLVIAVSFVLIVGGGAVFAMMRRKLARLELARGADGEALLSAPAQAALASGGAVASGGAETDGSPSVTPLVSPLAGLYELIDSRPAESLAVIRAWIADGEAA
jgi:flagellar M-ring protein FliF